MHRRQLILGAAVTLMHPAGVLARAAPRFARDPFTLGVASGYPTPGGVTLWTRLAPDPLAPDGGLDPIDIPVQWELGEDASFRRIVRQGTAYAEAAFGHSVHCDLGDLEPDREYWYRFRAGDARSPVGRTRTAPAVGATPQRLRLALASCQMYEHGHFAAWRQIVADATDLVVHVGDYIYEVSWGQKRIRQHGSGECYTLGDYRARHALYKLDPDLAAAHAACPWVLTWDDHEVDNDYADDVSVDDDDPRLFLGRRAAAYQAYYEHLPLPRSAAPVGGSMRLYTALAFGDLASLCLLDTRQYRSPHPCPPAGRRGSTRLDPATCTDFNDPARSMLGVRQEAWLGAQLARSRSRWNLLAQSLVMAHNNEVRPPAQRYWTDAWSGYPQARARLLAQLEATRVRNPVVLGGDIHAFVASTLHQRADDPTSPPLAAELVTTSISSEGTPLALLESLLANNPATIFGESRYRGWTRIDVRADRLTAECMALDDVYDRQSDARSIASFVVENGRAGLSRV